MRWVNWTIRLVLLVFLVALAAKNVDPVTVRFYFDVVLSAPLIVVLFATFTLGAVFGVLALLGTLLRQRREISSLRSQSRATPPAPPPPAPPL